MVQIMVGRSNYQRDVLRTPEIVLKNRWFEQNPVLNAASEFTALISRPGMLKLTEIGAGHVRKVFSEPGTFDEDLFIVSGLSLYRMDDTATVTTIGAISSDIQSAVTMAATAPIGATVPEYLYITDGGVLWLYTANGQAQGHLQASGAVANNDTLVIGGVYYKWTNGSVDTGTPAGTVGSPWLVALGASTAEALDNMFHAINADGTPGTTYSTLLVAAHATVTGFNVSAADLYIAARTAGGTGNAITTTETGANISWSNGATLTGGGTEKLRQVPLPDDVGAISVAHINSYVIVVPAQGAGINGQFYWIEPGETYIDALNFATAERSPDAVSQVLVFSDRFWLLGQSTTEAWITTGNIDAPMQRFTGVLYDRGTWAGSAIVVGGGMVLVDPNGNVVHISGGLREVSRPDIAEQIRLAMNREALYT